MSPYPSLMLGPCGAAVCLLEALCLSPLTLGDLTHTHSFKQ